MATSKQADMQQLAAVLADGIATLSLDLSQQQQALLLDYLALLLKWNTVYNLTAVRDPLQMVTHHLLDSLAAVPAFISASRVLDVGAGGGLPGIVLAIACPTMQVHMIDTVHKKTAFLTQVRSQLRLMNVTVHTGRVEQLDTADKFDVITSRAFADLSDFVSWSGHLLADAGRFIALKGVVPVDEIARLPAGWKVTEVVPLCVPGLDAERHLLMVGREAT
ncbi:16S rRNA m(7)G-527 methyltransferase [Noviherbaspirillum humi]|uniref:Ribosomal RNA small subunit methyltransferase G n=1 Tax=Noviherbaspirillum humi TaxID=1688639 RepID=A0A239BYI4_9BURK|nr:16S rRNA (guanine(527)-N(7))-methyltransferase RsmG [Noviherbaspirillum humi]SNS12950.1 16S rRNA m(7)G-527 methyltransferase [Noviherbaspirillum humi]